MPRRLTATIIGLMLSAVAPVVAEEFGDDILKSFVGPEDGARSCWSRAYTDAHLVEHPNQKVTEMYFGLQHTETVSEDWPEGRTMYYYVLRAKQRGWSDFAEASGNCLATPDGRISCGVECDGGGVVVAHDDGGAVLVDLERSGFIRMLSCGADGERVVLRAGEDDKTFLLSPQPDDQCSEIVIEDPDAGVD
jgi:hypothetical protein